MRKNVRKKQLIILTLAMLAFQNQNITQAADNFNGDALNEKVFMQESLFPISKFNFDGNTHIPSEHLQQLTKQFIGLNKDTAALVRARDIVLKEYQKKGYSMVTVIMPKNIGLDGVVNFKIIEVKVGKISVSGNLFFTKDKILKSLPALQEGQSVNFPKLAKQLFLANDNPSRSMRLNFKNSGNEEFTDIEIEVQDKKPQVYGVSLDNTGTSETGNMRLNLFQFNSDINDRGDLFSTSYVTSPNGFNDVKQFGIFYQIPMETGDKINITGSYSNVDSGTLLNVLDVSGQGTGFGIHHIHYLDRTLTSKRYIDTGIDRRKYNNNLLFYGMNLGVDVMTNPFSIEYGYSDSRQPRNVFYDISYVNNISGGSDNTNETYDLSRSGATANYGLWRFHAGYQVTNAKGWTFNLVSEGQYTDSVLISNEEFALGGVNSIRGFNEREALGDKGLRLTTEFYTPVQPKNPNQRYVLFWDQGWLGNNDNSGSNYLGSIGFGWRYSDNKNFSEKVDLGYVLNSNDKKTTAGHAKIHYTVTYWF